VQLEFRIDVESVEQYKAQFKIIENEIDGFGWIRSVSTTPQYAVPVK
jgi:hypothetical protein